MRRPSDHDPYAGRPPRPRPTPDLPVDRLNAAHASPRLMDALHAWWEGLAKVDKINAHDQIVGDDDDTLRQVIASMDQLCDAPADTVKAWVSAAGDTKGAARLALAFEETARRPRTGLRVWLDERIR